MNAVTSIKTTLLWLYSNAKERVILITTLFSIMVGCTIGLYSHPFFYKAAPFLFCLTAVITVICLIAVWKHIKHFSKEELAKKDNGILVLLTSCNFVFFFGCFVLLILSRLAGEPLQFEDVQAVHTDVQAAQTDIKEVKKTGEKTLGNTEEILSILRSDKEKSVKIRELSKQLDLKEKTIIEALKAFGEENVNSEEWGKLLLEKAQSFYKLKEDLARLKADSQHNKKLFEKALRAVEEENIVDARNILLEIEKNVSGAVKISAQAKAVRAQIFMTEWEYREAAQLFETAARMVKEDDTALYSCYLHNAANAFYTFGDRKGNNKALSRSIDLWQEILKEYTKNRELFKWAGTQNNLGIALSILGERENDTERLKESVKAYQNALKEYTIKRVPLDWAMTQNNLGGVLLRLGEREGGTAKLKKAVEAYRNALKEYQKSGAQYYIVWTKRNLKKAEALLDARINKPPL